MPKIKLLELSLTSLANDSKKDDLTWAINPAALSLSSVSH